MPDLPNLPPELAVEEEPFDLDDLDSVLADAHGIFRVDPDRLIRDHTLDAETMPFLTRTPARWRVTDDRSAEWAARHWRETVDALDELGEKRAFWIAQIVGWAEGRTTTLDNRRRFMEAQLEEYALEQRAATNGKRKTVSLPSATVRTRPQSAKPEVIDGKVQEFIGWASRHLPDLVRVKEEPKLAEFSEYLTIRRVVDHYAYHADLECGHHIEGRWDVPEEGSPPKRVDVAECEECPPDPIDGHPIRAATRYEENPVWRYVVMATIPNPDFDPSHLPEDEAANPETIEVEVPGLQVRPEDVTAKVGR